MSKEFLRHYPHTFNLDGESVAIHIKRMTFEESQEFFFRSAELEKTVFKERVYRHQGAEQEKDEKGAYKISFEELCQQRLSEMSVEERAEIEAAQTARIKEQAEFMAECMKRYVIHVEPGLVDVHPDGSKHPVTNGEELLEIVGARRELHLQLYQAIFAENHLNAHQKKALQLLATSKPSSIQPKKDRVGRKRKTTAKSAGASGSAGSGAARNRQSGRSGSGGRVNGRSPSIAAPS